MTRLLQRRGADRGPRVRGGGDPERGAVMVEFTIVSVLLLLLVAGTFDFGMAWRSGLEVNEAARTGARVGSSQGNKTDADFSIMSSLQATLESSGGLDSVEKVIIFRADTEDGEVPASCQKLAPTGDDCNVFDGAQVRALPEDPSGAFDETTGCLDSAVHNGWCPDDRDDVQLSADYLGVYVQTRYQYTFRLLGESTLVSRKAVMRLEPPDPQDEEEDG